MPLAESGRAALGELIGQKYNLTKINCARTSATFVTFSENAIAESLLAPLGVAIAIAASMNQAPKRVAERFVLFWLRYGRSTVSDSATLICERAQVTDSAVT